MNYFEKLKVHSEPVKVSKAKKELENKVYYFLEKGIETPYLEFLIDLIEKENNKKIVVFYTILEKMEENGLGKQFFPVLYLMTLSYFKNKQGFENNISIGIGGWSIFFYRVMSKGLDDAIRFFRGSHDDDQIAKNEFVSFLLNIYKDKGLEIIKETHLDKKSCYIIDKAIQIEEIEKALKNYNNLLTHRSLGEIIKKLNLRKIKETEVNEDKLKEVGEKLNELKDYLSKEKDKYLKEIRKYLDRNFYLKNLIDYGKTGNKVFLDKFGRLELDLYLPNKGYIEIGNVKIKAEELFNCAVEFRIGENNNNNKIVIVDPYHLTLMKLNAGREKDINDLINLYESLFELTKTERKHYNLKNPFDYLKRLSKDYKKLFLTKLKNSSLYKKRDKIVLKLVDFLENY